MRRFQDYINEINQFFRDNGQQIDPVPSIKIDETEQDRFDPYIKTANYDPKTNTITLFVSNRHVKDILRSYSHELFHHVQNISGENGFEDVGGNLSENPGLEEIEGNAYLNGNILFRKWTESSKNS